MRVVGVARRDHEPEPDLTPELGWRLAAAAGSFAPVAVIMSGVIRDSHPPKWLLALAYLSAAVATGALARRLGRFVVPWALGSAFVAGIPGLLLCTLPSRRRQAPGPSSSPAPAPAPPPRPPAPRPAPRRSSEPLDAAMSIEFATDEPLTVFVSAYDRGARCLEIHDAIQQDTPRWLPASATNGAEMIPGRGTPRSLVHGMQLAIGLGARPGMLRRVRVRSVLDPETVLRVHALERDGALTPERAVEVPLLRYASNIAIQLGHRVTKVSREDTDEPAIPASEVLAYWSAMGDGCDLAGKLGVELTQPVRIGYDLVLELERNR